MSENEIDKGNKRETKISKIRKWKYLLNIS